MSTAFHMLLVGVGSGLGGLARYGVANAVAHFTGLMPHWATMGVNISGSLLLGWFVTMLTDVWTANSGSWIHAHGEQARLLVAVGFTGGYTTFSSFEAETYRLFRDQMTFTAIAYVAGSVFLGLAAFRIGMMLAGAR